MTSLTNFVRTTIETSGPARVASVVIDNDRKLNTLNSELMAQLMEALEGLAQEEDLRAVVLGSAGSRAFIGGADIDEMACLDPSTARAFITAIHECCAAIRRLPVPVIARIQGYAFGGGLDIAAACDLRIASDDALFGMPEVRLGVPSVIEAATFPMLIGWGRTRRMLLLGETFTAAEVLGWGFVERVVPKDDLDAAVLEWVSTLLEATPRAIRLQKALMRSWEDLPLQAAIHAGIDAFVEAWRTDEPRVAMQAFQSAQAARKQARR